MTSLHTFHDGSTLRTVPAKSLIGIPIWKGNRILNTEHVSALQTALGSRVKELDSGYCVIQVPEVDAGGKEVVASYIIDGQHRAAVLKAHFEPPCFEEDFDVVVRFKRVHSETEAISYFNAINNVKPQQWKHDKKLVANAYIVALEGDYNTKKLALIRPGATCRPYLSVDKLREQLLLYPLDPDRVTTFRARVAEWNRKKCEETRLLLAMQSDHKDTRMLARALEVGFLLAMDYGWTLLLP